MAAKLKSLWRNPTLRLALKSGFLTYLIFLYKYHDSGLYLLAFSAVALYLYIKNAVPNTKLFRHFVLATALVFIFPSRDVDTLSLAAICFGVALGIILGLKGVIFIKRGNWRLALNILLLILAAWTLSYYYAGAIPKIALFAATIFLSRDWLVNVISLDARRADLVASSIALLVFEVYWVASLFSPPAILSISAMILVAVLVSWFVLTERLRSFTI